MLAPSSETAEQARELDGLLEEVLLFFQGSDERAIALFELGWSEYLAIRHIGQNGPPTMHGLAETLDLTKGGATRLVDRLERRALVRRRRDTLDARVALVYLTEAGEELLTSLRQERMEERLRLIARMGPTAREQVVSALRTLRHAVRDLSTDNDNG